MLIIIQEGFGENARTQLEFANGCATFAVPEVWQSWSIAPVLKTGVPQGTGGSNPSASAKKVSTTWALFFWLHMGSRQAVQSPVQPLVNLNQ